MVWSTACCSDNTVVGYPVRPAVCCLLATICGNKGDASTCAHGNHLDQGPPSDCDTARSVHASHKQPSALHEALMMDAAGTCACSSTLALLELVENTAFDVLTSESAASSSAAHVLKLDVQHTLFFCTGALHQQPLDSRVARIKTNLMNIMHADPTPFAFSISDSMITHHAAYVSDRTRCIFITRF